MSNIVEKVKDKVEAVLHKDKHANTHTGVAGTHSGTHTAGTGVHSGSTNAGPHDSNLLNKADPRVDSDRDNSHNLGAASHGPGGHTGGHGIASGTGVGSGTGFGSGSTNHGPHDSNLGNKVDPRVDSDRDGSRNAGAAAYGPGAHGNSSGLGSTGLGSGSSNTGPHSSNLANKLDPRVDSDNDGSRNAGAASYGAGAHQSGTGIGGNSGTGLGGHSTGLGGHSGAGVGGHSGTGLTGNTGSTNAGPHNSNLLNKVDPRVDSDRDGSNTLGSGVAR